MTINGTAVDTDVPMRFLSLVFPTATNRSAAKFASILYIVVLPVYDPIILGYILHGSAETTKGINTREVRVRNSLVTVIYV